MKINQILKLETIQFKVEAKSKKSLLELISKSLLPLLPKYDQHQLFDHFLERERLGSTAIGHGIAIPHARLPGNNETIATVISVKEAIDFNASDDQKVNLFFALIVPENSTQEHLSILSTLARFFRDEKNRSEINNATSAQALYDILCRIN